MSDTKVNAQAPLVPCEHGVPGLCMVCIERDIQANREQLSAFYAEMEGDAVVFAAAPRHVDARDTELATLRAQLADAVRVIDAARPVRSTDRAKIMERVRAFEQALRDYDAKHGRK